MVSPAAAEVILAVIKFVVLVWDFLTYPIYQVDFFSFASSTLFYALNLRLQAIQRPWEKRKAMSLIRAKVVRTSAEEVVYEATEVDCPIDRDLVRSKVGTQLRPAVVRLD